MSFLGNDLPATNDVRINSIHSIAPQTDIRLGIQDNSHEAKTRSASQTTRGDGPLGARILSTKQATA